MIFLRITIQKGSSENFSLWHGETIEHGFGKSAPPLLFFVGARTTTTTGNHHPPPVPVQQNQSK